MKRTLQLFLIGGTVITFSLGCISFFSANEAYKKANIWFSRATYNAQCPSIANAIGCKELSLQEPDWPSRVEVTDKDVLLAQAGALHNTGSGVLTLGGLFMATSAVLLAGTVFTQRRDAGQDLTLDNVDRSI
jgi:hypothetical protein